MCQGDKSEFPGIQNNSLLEAKKNGLSMLYALDGFLGKKFRCGLHLLTRQVYIDIPFTL